MNCPTCQSQMLSGALTVEEFDGCVSFTTGDAEPIVILTPFQNPATFHCTACGTTILCGADGTESTCLECDTPLPPGVTRCKACGWSYVA